MEGPRLDRREDLVRLGRREDELHVRRRLLDHLQQRVERRRGDHVRLVDHVDLEPRRHRREERPLAQVAGVVDQAVRGRVDLDDVERARTHRRQRDAGVALAARRRGRALLAVERTGEDAGARGLAAAARAAEQVGVVDPAGVQRLADRPGDVLLADDLGEACRAGTSGTARATSERGLRRAERRTPRTPARAHLPLLPSGPGGVGRDSAARGVGAHCSQAATSRPVHNRSARPRLADGGFA